MRETVRDFMDLRQVPLILLFLGGLIAGFLLTNQVIDPFIYKDKIGDYNKLVEINSGLDKRNDQLYSCLLQNNVNPENCSAKNGSVNN